MTDGLIPIYQLFFGHKYWRSYRAIDEIVVYCDLLDHLQEKIDALETRGKDEEATLASVQVVISSYALEIAMKSFWALDHPDKIVPPTHDLVKLFDGLKEETKKALEGPELTREVLEVMPKPFVSNRYSMENGNRDTVFHPPSLLRNLTQLLRDKLEDNRKALYKSQTTSTD